MSDTEQFVAAAISFVYDPATQQVQLRTAVAEDCPASLEALVSRIANVMYEEAKE